MNTLKEGEPSGTIIIGDGDFVSSYDAPARVHTRGKRGGTSRP